MPPKKEVDKLSDEQIKSAELKKEIKDRHNYLKKTLYKYSSYKRIHKGR